MLANVQYEILMCGRCLVRYALLLLFVLLGMAMISNPRSLVADSTREKPAVTSQPIHLTFLQMNDSHAYLDLHQEVFPGPVGPVFRKAGGYARIAAIANQIRQETQGHMLFCDCGDTFYGTYPAQQSKGQVLVPVLNALGLAAMTPHWEFVFGPKRFRELASQLNFPVLAVNIYEKDSGKHIFPACTIIETAGLKVGLIGAASNIVDKTMPPAFSEGLRFTLGREELPPIVKELRDDKKVDLVVLISHLGFPQDMKLLSEVPGVDICLSGHTHNRLYQPVRQGKTIIIQSGCHGSFLGRLDVQIQDRQVVGFKHQLLEVAADIPPDPQVQSLIDTQMAPYQKQLAEIVGHTKTALHRGTCLESPMDNLLLDALMECAGAQVAFSNGWRYAAPVVPGPIAFNDLNDMIPINPPVSTTKITGKEVLAMLEENLERTFSRDAYDQMGGYVKRCGGMQVHVKLENPPGTRIQKVYIRQQELQPDAVYLAAFVTEQGVPARYGRDRRQLPVHAVDALKEYLAKHDPVMVEPRNSFIVE